MPALPSVHSSGRALPGERNTLMGNDDGRETLKEQGARYRTAHRWQVGMGLLRLTGVLMILFIGFLLLRYGSL